MYVDKGMMIAELYEELMDVKPNVVVFQDNMSVLQLIENGGGIYRNKPLRVRLGYLRSLKQFLIYKHVASEKMLADGATKNLCGRSLKNFRMKVLGASCKDDEEQMATTLNIDH
jgi:hypothetical protein